MSSFGRDPRGLLNGFHLDAVPLDFFPFEAGVVLRSSSGVAPPRAWATPPAQVRIAATTYIKVLLLQDLHGAITFQGLSAPYTKG